MLAERVKEWTHEWEAKGMQKGMQKGRQEGMQKGESGMLLRQMHLKFGELDAAIVDRVESADTEQLVAWSGRILTAKTVEEIFQS